MIVRLAAVLIATSLGLGSTARASCETFDAFVRSGALPELADVAPACSQSRVLGGGASQDCFYTFPFRSDIARAHFAALRDQLRACADASVTTEDGGVNHPDSFDQITARMNGRDVSLSLKDKGALGKTLIVLRRDLP